MSATVAAAATAVALAGCSVRVQDQPEPVSDGVLVAPLQAAGGPALDLAQRQAWVFLVRGDRLVSVRRNLPPGDLLAEALDAAAAGPVATDPAGLHSALQASSAPVGASVFDGVAVIALPPGFGRLGARNEIVAVAQLVFTATAEPGVGGVRLTQDGNPIDAPTGTGALVSRPVTRQDYPALAPG